MSVAKIRNHHIPVIDRHNSVLYYVRPTEVERLVLEGRVQARGSRSRIHVLVVIDHRDDHLLADERPRLHQRYSNKRETFDNPPGVWRHLSTDHWVDS